VQIYAYLSELQYLRGIFSASAASGTVLGEVCAPELLCTGTLNTMHRRILIVAEDAFVRDLIRLSLVGLGAEVRCVTDCEGMRALCRRVTFDLIIVMQASMFLCGGNPVREMRPAGLRHPVVYVLSWQQAEQTVLSLLEAGVDQYMTFPVSLQRLRRKVADELERCL